MRLPDKSVLLIGEAGVGKSHYGGQLLKRLMQENGRVRMCGAATNLEPFEAVMARLDEGLLADHTATAIYHESRWPVIDDEGFRAHLIWPDYGGEQILNIINERRIPYVWMKRIAQSSGWLLLIRLQNTRVDDDIFSRPLTSLKPNSREPGKAPLSDQARLIELLQILVYAQSTSDKRIGGLPSLTILLTCWDEMETPGKPIEVLHERLPLFEDFVASNWVSPSVLGLSALERELDKEVPDESYVTKGSERFGYVVLEDGTRSTDLTLPIWKLLVEPSRL